MRTTLEIAFWVAFGVGLSYGLLGFLVRGLLHGFDFGDHGIEVGGHDIGEHGLELGEHEADVGGADAEAGAAEANPSPFNTLTIAAFLLSFGALGLLALRFGGLGVLVSFFIALLGALGLAAAFFFGFMRLVYRSQSTSAPTIDSILRAPARVSVTVPAGGTGEISYVAAGSRFTLPARAMGGQELARGTEVAIVEIRRGVAYVASIYEGRELKPG